jgi:serine/threonine-protein kinase
MQSIGPETIVDGRYRILHRLGSGGMAEVWAAEDSQLGRRVALKLLASRYAKDPDFVERFRREASAAAAMQHPNIVSIYDRGEWDGTSYIAMELVDGRTLKQLIQERGPAGPSAAIDITIEILKALRYAHKRGIVHRDIKPQNVLLDAEGAVKVADFGIARADGPSEMTEDGAIMGTVQYVSPEQAQGQPVSPASDLYSAGIVLYELLTGRVPFDGEAPVSIALKQVNEPPVPPSQLRPGIPPALEQVVLRSLEKDPARRYASADEFIGALEAARRAPVRQVVMEPTPGEPWEPALEEEDRGSRWWAWLLALVVLALIAGGLYYLLAGNRVTVPDVKGKTFSSAVQRLHESGLEVTPVSQVSDSVAQGRVISTSPPAGDKVKKHSSVVVRVSSGKGTAQIPQVVGQTEAQAKQALIEAGFTPKVKTAYSDTVPKGQVISSDPPPGESHTKASTVTLTVSKGKQGETVPKLTGLSRDDAVSALDDLGLTSDITFKESSEDPNTVLAQSPAAGTKVDKGSSVRLTVAKERPQVPDVTTGNPSEADATKQLEDAGYKVQTRPDNNAPANLVGKVTGQDPQPGERRSTGATVIIKIGAAATPTPTPTPTTTPADASPTPTSTPVQ